jgi:hypothetical protein
MENLLVEKTGDAKQTLPISTTVPAAISCPSGQGGTIECVT